MLGKLSFIVILLIGCLSGSSVANIDVDKAVLAGEWQLVYDSIDNSDGLNRQTKEVLKSLACLELDFDCTSYTIMFSLEHPTYFRHAEKWAKHLRKANPTNSIPPYLLGVIYSYAGQDKDVLSYFTQAIELDSANAMSYVQRGLYYAVRRQYVYAISDLDEAIRRKPNHSMPYTNRGAAYDGLGRFEEALADYATAIGINPEFQSNYYNRGNTYRHMGDNESAIREFTSARNLDSTKAATYLNRGNAYSDVGKFEEALSDYHKFLEIVPEELEMMKPTANFQIDELTRLIEGYPDDPVERLMEWGIHMFERGDYRTAEKLLTETILSDSTRADAYYWRAAIYTKTSNTQGAIDDFSKAIFYKPNDTTAHYNRAKMYSDLGKHSEAIRGYTDAITLNKNYALAYMARAESYENTGQVDLAIADYEVFIKVCPKNQKERRRNVKGILRVLKSDSSTKGFAVANSSIETILIDWASENWVSFTASVIETDLEQFKELCLPFTQKMGQSESQLFIHDGKAYSWGNAKNWSPQRFFEIYLGVLSSKKSKYHDLLDISFIRMIDVVPRGGKRVLFSFLVAIGSDETPQEITLEGYAVMVKSEWKIEMPALFMNIAQELNDISKK